MTTAKKKTKSVNPPQRGSSQRSHGPAFLFDLDGTLVDSVYGYGEDELVRAGAYRVYADPADLLKHLDEVGVRPAE
jgi:phosphoglycolate phosphatase-like HAD superfamily hydrolase